MRRITVLLALLTILHSAFATKNDLTVSILGETTFEVMIKKTKKGEIAYKISQKQQAVQKLVKDGFIESGENLSYGIDEIISGAVYGELFEKSVGKKIKITSTGKIGYFKKKNKEQKKYVVDEIIKIEE